MSDIHRLIYLSAAREEMAPDQLEAILTVARKNNEPAGVTGLLLFHDGSFFQVLEGPKDEVVRIFSAIEKDPRHSRVIILETKTREERAFPNWSMGYVRAHALRPDQKAHLVDLGELVAREQPVALSSSLAVSGFINTFLSSFREFGPI
ncbi:MAG: BLUF domain-containing protein [Hyphomonadaceae bacterium]